MTIGPDGGERWADTRGAIAPSPDDVALLHTLLEIPSLSGQERPVAERLCAEMERRGLRASIDAAGNAIGETDAPPGAPEIVLLGHMDTAPGAVAVRLDGDLLYGRGAVDAKGPLAAFVCAAARMQARGTVPLRVVVIGAVEEECASSAGARFVAARPAPAACIVGEPSRWDRVTLGYKGRLLLEYVLRQEAAHSAANVPTAAERAVAFWNGVVALAAAMAPVGPIHAPAEFDRLSPALTRIDARSDGIVDEATAHISLRLPVGCDTAALRAHARELAGPAVLHVSEDVPAYRGNKNTPLVRSFLSAIRVSGGRPAFALKTGTSDMNIVGPAWACPILAYGPGDSGLDHTPHEHISLREYARAIAVLDAALLEFAAALG